MRVSCDCPGFVPTASDSARMSTAWKQQRQADWKAAGNWFDNAGNDINKELGKAANSLAIGKGSFEPEPPSADKLAGYIAKTPDATDDAIRKARTSFALRLQAGKNQSNSFASGQLGGFDVMKPTLGGY